MREDAPILSCKSDLFNRTGLATAVAQSIMSRYGQQSSPICIGIFGKWGEGKTSFMNMIKEKILEKGNKKYKIINFNPWNSIDGESLWDEYFDCLARNYSKETRNKIIEYGKWFSKPISVASRILISKLSNDTELGKDVQDTVESLLSGHPSAKSKSLLERKQAISNDFTKSKSFNIIFIDDLDRLENEELRNVFRLIRQIADFDNTVYVIGMDAAVVSESLDKYYSSCNGLSFIDKIINVPITLPTIQQDSLRRYFVLGISSILSRQNIQFSYSDLDDLSYQIIPLLGTMRELIRFVNQLEFDLPIVENEVNISDFILIEAIKMTSPKAYHSIYANRELVTREQAMNPYDIKASREEISNKLKKLISDIVEFYPSNKQTYISKILKGNLIGTRAELINEEYEKRLQSKTYFSRYFTLIVDENQVPESKIETISSYLDDTEKARKDFLEIFVQYGQSELNRVVRHILHSAKIGEDKAQICSYLTKALYPRKEEKEMPFCSLSMSILVSRVILEEAEHNSRRIFYDASNDMLSNAELTFAIQCYSNLYNSMIFELEDIKKMFPPIKERIQHCPEFYYGASSSGILSITTAWVNDNKEEFDSFIRSTFDNNCIGLLLSVRGDQVYNWTILEKLIGSQLLEDIISNALEENKQSRSHNSLLTEIIMNTSAGNKFKSFSSE